ncbi:hypothetical protein C4E22_00540 [ANME-1 cluster archaeon AG-394-G06]|nr:hypothetical protein [ANME-1 cluster archaeon AG-394-G06]
MKRQIIAFLIALVVVTGLTVSVHSEETFDKNLGNYEQTVIAELSSALKSMGDISVVKDTADRGCLTALTKQQDSDFIKWSNDTGETQVGYINSVTLALDLFNLDSAEFWFGEMYRDASDRLVEIDKFDVSPAMQPAKNEFKLMLQDLKQGAYYGERGVKNLDTDDLDTGTTYFENATEHLENFKKLTPEDTEEIPEDTEEIPTFLLVDNVSLCDAIYISIGNASVTDFLNATNMTTVQVYNFKGYKGENTWKVQWSFSNRLLDVYINVTTGSVVGIEEKTTPTPAPTSTPTPTATLFEKIEGLTAITVVGGSWSWDNWDADMENDGFVIQIMYLDARGNPIIDENIKKMPISADVKLYVTDSVTGPKDKLVFSAHYTEDEIILDSKFSCFPEIRIPKEEISVNPSTDYQYGAVEVTIYTPVQGSFADRVDSIRLYEE